jgi:RNA polymerase sigma-70 factor, ECF subfamily
MLYNISVMQNLCDEELVVLVKQGEIAAYEILVKRYQRKLLGFAYHVTRGARVAEDAVQDAMLAVYKNIEKIDTKRKFSTYIFEITKNKAIDYLRKIHHEVTLEETVAIDEEEDIYEKIAAHENAKKVNDALSILGVKYREILRLYYFEDLSYEEIARKKSMSINTVRTHLRRGKEKLKSVLEDRISNYELRITNYELRIKNLEYGI